MEGSKMAEESWHGIPRNQIPWHPTIDHQKCILCGKCVDFCHTQVFSTQENEEGKSTIVKNPNNCVVTCTGCDSICPAGAISHPSKKEFFKNIREIRKSPEYKLKKANVE